MSCSVYVIAPRSNADLRFCRPVKVGISANPWARSVTLQTGHWVDLVVAYQIAFPSRDDAAAWEAEFHRTFAECRMRGEWFDMMALDAVNWLCDEVGMVVPEGLRL